MVVTSVQRPRRNFEWQELEKWQCQSSVRSLQKLHCVPKQRRRERSPKNHLTSFRPQTDADELRRHVKKMMNAEGYWTIAVIKS